LVPVLGHVKEDPALYPLVYGNTEVQIGWIKIYNDELAVHVHYEITEPGWGIKETHLLITLKPIVWTSSGDYPPGKYTYQHVFGVPYPTTDAYHITEVGSGQFGKDPPKKDFSTLPVGTSLYIIAHAAVVGPTGQQETAFGGGFRNASTVLVYGVQREGEHPSVPALPILSLPAAIIGLGFVLRRSRK